MKYLTSLLFILLSAVLITAIVLTAKQTETQERTRLTVATTIFPLTDIATQLVGEDTKVIGLLPPGTSPHTFEPTPSDIRNLQSAEVLFVVGHGLDDWATELAESVKVEVVVVDDGVTLREFVDEHAEEEAHEDDHDEEGHDDDHAGDEDAHEEDDHNHEGTDPHYWLSVQNAQAIVDAMTVTMQTIDPAFADEYAQNAAAYKETLTSLQVELATTLTSLADMALIVFHDSWSYFAEEYDLKIVGVFEPSPGKAPSPQDMQQLTDLVKAYDISVVFGEPQLSESTLLPFVQDLDLMLFTLDPVGGVEGRATYVELMRYNAGVLVEALSQ